MRGAENLTKKLQSWVEIDSKALRYNFRFFKNLIGPRTNLMAVVKSNAYGHGTVESAKILEDLTDWFGVFSIDEAFDLRRAEIKNPILILGYTPPVYFRDALQKNISLSIISLEHLKALAALNFRVMRRLKVHLKIETGFNRQGICLAELPRVIDIIKKSQIAVGGIYTHFSDVANLKSQFWKKQLEKFKKAVSYFKENGICLSFIHTAATAAAILYPETHFNMVRVGIGLWGYFPPRELEHLKNNLKLKPALSWKTKIMQTKTIKKGESVGYDRGFFAKKKTRIAVLPVGYWDGYDRKLSNKGEVLIKGRRCRVLGVVSMNMTVVDITDSPQAKNGDEVLLLGGSKKDSITAFEMAEKVGTIHYEILSRINPLIPRIVI